MHGHTRAVRTILQISLKNFSQIYMKWTYFLFDINNYVLRLQWGNLVVTFNSEEQAHANNTCRRNKI